MRLKRGITMESNVTKGNIPEIQGILIWKGNCSFMILGFSKGFNIITGKALWGKGLSEIQQSMGRDHCKLSEYNLYFLS